MSKNPRPQPKRDYWAIRDELKRAVLAMDAASVEASKQEHPDIYESVWNQMKKWERKQGVQFGD